MKLVDRLKKNLIVLTLRRSSRLLTNKEKQRAVTMALYSLFSVFIDVAGLSLLIPVMMAANDPTLVTGPVQASNTIAQDSLGVSSADSSKTATYGATKAAEPSKPNILHRIYKGMGFKSYESYMLFLAVCVLLVFILKNSITLFVGYMQSRFAYDVATSLARRQYMKYYNRGYTYFKETNSADIVNNIINIPIFYVGGVLLSLINFLTESAVLLLIIVGIAVVDIKLFGALLIVLVPSGLAIYGLTKNRLYAIGQEQLRLGAITFSRINQAIFGFVDVRLTNKENYFLRAYEKEQVSLNETFKVKHVIAMVPSRALEVIAVLGILVIFGYAFFLGQGSGTIFEFVAIFAAAAFRVLPSMNRSLAALMGIKSQMFSLEVLEEGELPTKMEKMDVRPMEYAHSIEFKDVSFSFTGAETKALNGVNFTVKKGEKIGIVGESGSGKTTLMNILLRFLREDEGGIYIDGKKLEYEDIASWRAKVGYVQQQVFLIDASLKQNVAFGEDPEEIDEERLKMALEQASLIEFVHSLPHGWDTQVGEMGARLSGGQRQRIGIARALYYQSSVLVFDEATSALDTETENLITESIQALQRDKTVFVIAHRLTTLRNCDRILEFKHGKLVAVWSYADLVTEKMLK
ncbi:MAG TPA: ABC transporter ATP-binding protein [Bacteroidia bacterium]|nr:ABC transporter ATP-binding protein [Bacteroidia bacterium]